MGEMQSLLEQQVKAPYFFSEIPAATHFDRLMGTEHELGTEIPGVEMFREDWLNLELPNFIENGGRIYEDGTHAEMSTPETTNIVQAIASEKAMEWYINAHRIKTQFASRLFKDNINYKNRDRNEGTWGSHENYFTRVKNIDECRYLIPFLVTRQIITGSGLVMPDGSYHLSQRSGFITKTFSPTTTNERGIICVRGETLGTVHFENGKDNSAYKRMHVLLGDSNMCEGAILLKLGTTKLVLDLIEEGRLPKKLLEYREDRAIHDLNIVSESLRDWKVTGMPGTQHALDIQFMYFDIAAKHYAGRDSTTDMVLHLWGDTLNKLRSNPLTLKGRLDWVTKKVLLDTMNEEQNEGYWITAGNAMNYHDLDKENSLFYWLQRNGLVEKYLADSLIEHHVLNAPRNTRAFARGEIVKAVKRKYPGLEETEGTEWGVIYFPRSRLDQKWDTYPIPEPFNNYAQAVDEIKAMM